MFKRSQNRYGDNVLMALDGQPGTTFRCVAHNFTEQIAAVAVFNLAIEAILSGNHLQTKMFHKIINDHGTSPLFPFTVDSAVGAYPETILQ